MSSYLDLPHAYRATLNTTRTYFGSKQSKELAFLFISSRSSSLIKRYYLGRPISQKIKEVSNSGCWKFLSNLKVRPCACKVSFARFSLTEERAHLCSILSKLSISLWRDQNISMNTCLVVFTRAIAKEWQGFAMWQEGKMIIGPPWLPRKRSRNPRGYLQ